MVSERGWRTSLDRERVEKDTAWRGAFSCFCSHVLSDYCDAGNWSEERQMKALTSQRSSEQKRKKTKQRKAYGFYWFGSLSAVS